MCSRLSIRRNGEMVKKASIDRFVRLGGYNIVRHRSEKWKNISEASKRTGISRPTIYKILEKHPEEPSKVMPKYVEEFKESEGYRQLKKEYGKRDFWDNLRNNIRDAFVLLNKKDPISWNEQDFAKLWENYYNPRYKSIDLARGTNFRRLMELLPEGRTYLRKFKTKQPKPTKAHWYLEESEIIALMTLGIERIDVLILLLFGIFTGSRISGILTLKPQNINWVRNTLIIYETKIRTEVLKYINKSFMLLLDRYVNDFHIKPTDRCFPMSEDSYNRFLSTAGKQADIRKEISTQILKHTFTQQCKEHGVPAEVVVQQTHTELRTLQKWYSFTKEEKIRKHMQGKEWKPEPFHIFADRIVAHATKRYEQIKR